MLKNTFIFLPRVGKITERKIWNQGCLHWDNFLEREEIKGIKPDKKAVFNNEICMAQKNLEMAHSEYFKNVLPQGEQWRLFDEFGDSMGYLDIETTGLSPYESKTTTVSIFDGNDTTTLIRNQNLSRENLLDLLDNFKMFVTFYGASFDLPFLAHEFEIDFPQPHFDLCFGGRKVGLSGGLKNIEKKLGIAREDEIGEVDGFEAVRLWRRWEKYGDQDALDKLVKYNRADVVNLEPLSQIIYKELKGKTFVFD